MKNALGMFVVLMVALAMTGVAVAHWSDTVQIEGTVYMGDFIVGWRNIVDNTGENEEIASLKCTLEDPETSVHHTPAVTVYHTLKVEIDNAYPEYWARCWVNLKNAGTIPATIVELNMTPGPGLEIGENLYGPWGFQGWRLDNADTKKKVMIVKLVDNSGNEGTILGHQIEPCTEEEVRLWISILQDGAEPCHTYKFDIEVLAVQWNKAPEWGFGP